MPKIRWAWNQVDEMLPTPNFDTMVSINRPEEVIMGCRHEHLRYETTFDPATRKEHDWVWCHDCGEELDHAIIGDYD